MLKLVVKASEVATLTLLMWMSLVSTGLTGVIIVLWRQLRNSGWVLMITSRRLLRKWRHRETIVPARIRGNRNFSHAVFERLHSVRINRMMSPSVTVDLESPLRTRQGSRRSSTLRIKPNG